MLGLGGTLRLTNPGNGSLAYREAIKLIQDVTAGADVDFIYYLVGRGMTIWDVVPPALKSWARFAMNTRSARLKDLTYDELYRAGIEARPDCGAILDTEQGHKWLEASFLPKGE